MSDQVWSWIIQGATAIILALVGKIGLTRLSQVVKTGEATHILVNSNFGTQLKLNAVLSRRLADITEKQIDIEAAETAERLLRDHEAKQSIVDIKERE